MGVGRCRLHGGSTRNHVIAAKKTMFDRVLQTYGVPRTEKQDPRDILVELMQRVGGHVDWLGERIGEMDEQALIEGEIRKRTGENDGKEYWEVVEGTKPHVFLDQYFRLCELLYRMAKDTAGLGLLERKIELEGAQAGLMATVMIRMGDRLGLSAEQQALWPLMLAEELRAIDASEAVVASATENLQTEEGES